MSDSSARISADLDLTKAKSELNSFLNQNYKVDVQFNIKELDTLKKQMEEVFQSPVIKPVLDTSELETGEITALSQAFDQVTASVENTNNETQHLLSNISELGKTVQNEVSSAEASLNSMISRLESLQLSPSIQFEVGGNLSSVETILSGINAQLSNSQAAFGTFNSMLDNTANNWNTFNTLTQQQGKTETYTSLPTELPSFTMDSAPLKDAKDAGSGLLDVFSEIINTGSGLSTIFNFINGKTIVENLDWGKSSHKLNLPLSESIIMEKTA
jgi:ABC-type transporter Mla subunit MlaD